MRKKKKNITPMEKLTRNHEKFIKGKELNKDGKRLFDETLKETVEEKKKTN